MIKTTGLTKKFNEHLAVDRLDLDIPPGEVFGFLGPNGAGKTTTVRMLTCLICPTAGQAEVAGYKVGQDDQAIRQRVGILTETPGLYDRLTAWRNLLIYADLYEVDNGPKQIEKYLKLLDLWDRRNDTAGSFSKGMRQKLAIARSLLHEPEVLFLDEPTSGLDPEASKIVRDFIINLKGEGRTIFICTHNLNEASHLCDRVGLFRTQLRVLDTPAALQKGKGGRQVVFHLADAAENLPRYQNALVAMDEVNHVDIQNNKLLIRLDNPEQDNPAIIRTLVNEGAHLQFVGEVRHSLEDVYLQLMREAGHDA
ncbi:MAG TPA: ABC transporter ATP-binding protein [Anaerolineae bacterium]|nr:ABC transporter ATP-binding protein [Anaerolineae bacterium]